MREKLLPWGLDGVALGDRVLEVGPGFGATTRLLVSRVPELTVVEIDPGYCARLRRALASQAAVVEGDAARLPFEDGTFSGVVCFTMLHHLDSRELQDRAFAEIARVLVPGGVFAGTDSVGSGRLFKLIHIGDTLNLIDPGGLAGRLEAAGLAEPRVELASEDGNSFRWRARKAGVAG